MPKRASWVGLHATDQQALEQQMVRAHMMLAAAQGMTKARWPGTGHSRGYSVPLARALGGCLHRNDLETLSVAERLQGAPPSQSVLPNSVVRWRQEYVFLPRRDGLSASETGGRSRTICKREALPLTFIGPELAFCGRNLMCPITVVPGRRGKNAHQDRRGAVQL